MTKRPNDLEADIDALYRLPLAEFTAARNALASRLKKAGRAAETDTVKGLQKPTASAWAVNQLAWQHPEEIDALLEVGERFRAAQAAQLSGKAADLRGLLNERREALSRLMKRASSLLEGAGHAASPEAARRIATTLEALATWGRAEGAPRAGRLADDLDPPGFEAIAALVPRSGGESRGTEPTRVLPFRQEPRPRRGKDKTADEDADARRTRAREALRAAEQALREAQRDAERAEAALKKAAARAKAAEKEKQAIEQRYEKLQAEAQEAAKEARRVAQEAEGAAQAVSDAEQALAKAQSALEALS